MATYPYEIPANGSVTVNIIANSLAVEEAGDAFTVILDGTREYELRQGHAVVGEPFKEVRLENYTASPLAVKLHFALGEIKGAGQATVVSLGVNAPAVDSVAVGMAAVQIVGVNTARRQVTFKNNGGGTVYIGPAGVTVADGMPLEPTEGYSTDKSAAAFYAIAAADGGEVRVLEED